MGTSLCTTPTSSSWAAAYSLWWPDASCICSPEHGLPRGTQHGAESRLPGVPNTIGQYFPRFQRSLLTALKYPPQPSQQRYSGSDSPMAAYGSPVSGAQQHQPGWQPGYASPGYQGRGTPTSASSQMHPGIPYAFGQLPAHANPHDPKSQHPIPGSYNRNHNFNPKTQSFVPGANGMPPPGPQPPFTAPTSHHSSPQIGLTHPVYPGYQQGVPQLYGAGGHNMVRQASNNSVPGYHPPPQMAASFNHPPPPASQVLPQPPLQHVNPNQAAHIPPRPNVPHQGPSHVFSHLPTYGNPATLPQKPATGI